MSDLAIDYILISQLVSPPGPLNIGCYLQMCQEKGCTSKWETIVLKGKEAFLFECYQFNIDSYKSFIGNGFLKCDSEYIDY